MMGEILTYNNNSNEICDDILLIVNILSHIITNEFFMFL